MTMLDPIHIIGVGLAGPESLSPGMLRSVERADMLIGGSKILDGFREMPGKKIPLEGHLKALPRWIDRARKEGKKVVVLTSGDPNFFGIARLLREHFAAGELKIHPNVSSIQLAFARIGLAWEDAFFLSLHGREAGPVVDAVRRHGKVGILTDPKNRPGRVARLLLKSGLPDCRTFVCCRLGGHDEKIVGGRLSELAGRRFPDLNVMVILNESPEGPLGLPDMLLEHEGGMITRGEVRAVTLAKLRMAPGGVLWDVGASSGSVAIEAVRLVEGSTAYAVERSPKRLALMKKNIASFVPGRVIPVAGEAPEALRDLPDPDRVFVGGGGKRLPAILRTAVKRLREGGRMVVNTVTLESLGEARAVLAAKGFMPEVISLQVSRGKELAGRTMLKAENTVFVVSGERPREHEAKPFDLPDKGIIK